MRMLQNKVNQMNSDKLGLISLDCAGYSFSVAPQWAIGIETPAKLTATVDALSVFFYVASALVHHFLMCCLSAGFMALSGDRQQIVVSMVAQAGQPSGWPVFVSAGSLNLVWVTTNMKIETFGGGRICLLTEVAIMATVLTPAQSQYRWLFLAVRRSDVRSRPYRCEVTAPDYRAARRLVVRDNVALFAGRLPLSEVHHA